MGISALAVLLVFGCRPSADGPAPDAALGECAPDALPPRQIRLLTRAEYDRTVVDLLGVALPGAGGASCTTDADCDIDDQSCVAGTCAADPCSLVTFTYADGPGKSVVVAGAFNGWGPTAEAGGWAMSYEPTLGLYVTKRPVEDGTWPYKLVVDGTWIVDPANPSTVDDGYGGQNSVWLQACAGAAPAPDGAPSAGFPPESRPQHYPFDNAAESGLVTAVHAELYASAAQGLAERTDLAALLGCDPAVCTDDAWLSALLRRTFRRPAAPDELERYRTLLAAAPDAASGARAVLRALLQSPSFLYRVEAGVPDPSGAHRLDDHEIASAMSYLLWESMPDEALLAAADAGALSDPDEREAQARRMLADPRARAAFSRMVVQWLGVQEVPLVTRSASVYPAWSPELGAAMVRETEAFAAAVAFDDAGTFADLLTSDRMLAEPALAALYGVSPGEPMPPERRGLFGQAAFLTATSHSDQTSPIRRGVTLYERALCRTFGAPPAAAGGVPDVDPDATTRERYAQHTADPACASCHLVIDPAGFGLEGFDGIGAHRTTEHGLPIDTTGALQLGGRTVPYDGQVALAGVLAGSDEARTCFTTQTVRRAVGRLDVDACLVDGIDAASGGSLVDLLVAVVRSPALAYRTPETP